jgi:hypothetical protein
MLQQKGCEMALKNDIKKYFFLLLQYHRKWNVAENNINIWLLYFYITEAMKCGWNKKKDSTQKCSPKVAIMKFYE